MTACFWCFCLFVSPTFSSFTVSSWQISKTVNVDILLDSCFYSFTYCSLIWLLHNLGSWSLKLFLVFWNLNSIRIDILIVCLITYILRSRILPFICPSFQQEFYRMPMLWWVMRLLIMTKPRLGLWEWWSGPREGSLEERSEDWEGRVFSEPFMWVLKSFTGVIGIGIRKERVNQWIKYPPYEREIE